MSARFFTELKRRNVYRAAVFYAGAAWLLVQIATQVFPFFHIPEWVVRWIVIAAVVGFPFAMVFSWFYEWTPQGVRRESDIDRNESMTRETGRRMDRWIIAVLGLAVVLLLTDRFVLPKHEGSAGVMSIAVLPLLNEGGDPAEQYFSDGLSEDLITALAQFSGLKVISRNSSFQFRASTERAQDIGAKLGVARLLEGSVRRAGDAVRVRAELVSAEDGRTLWSQKFDRPYTDLFALQDEITRAVAAALKTKLTSAAPAEQTDHPPSGNLDAYNAYLQGRFEIAAATLAGQKKGIENLEEAIRLDPGYARAYAALSTTWSNLAGSTFGGAEKQDAFARADKAAQMALSIDPNLAAAHTAHGFYLRGFHQDWDGAEREYQQALKLSPDDTLAQFQLGTLLAGRGEVERALQLTEQLLRKDPRSIGAHNFAGKYLTALGRLDDAQKEYDKALELRPAHPIGYMGSTIVAVLRNDASAASTWAHKTPESNWRTIALALAAQIGDDRAAADKTLQTLIDEQADDSAFQIAEVYALRKEPDKVFEWLDHAYSTHDSGLGLLLYDPFLLAYRNDPRFAAFCRKVGLPELGSSAT